MDTSFKFEDLMLFSKQLWDHKDILSSGKYQCVYRTIINRVYYSAFHHTKYWLEYKYNFKTREVNLETGKEQNKDGLSEHKLVYKELRKVANQQKESKWKFKSASSKLEDLFNKRVEADYKPYLTFKEIEVEDAIKEASDILKLLII